MTSGGPVLAEGAVSVLIGGKVGEGISSAGQIIARLPGQLGYRAYMYFDYPSLILSPRIPEHRRLFSTRIALPVRDPNY